jgi:tetratricopeptide (TPR) repeat protein
MIGRRFGRYRIVAPLRPGGMARVWRAHDELLGREVALKLLAEWLRDSESARRRFRHEAELSTLFDHPAIAAVFESGEDDGETWMAMELVDGETVSARVARGLPPVEEAMHLVAEVAGALGYAHTRGVIHRDVTGGNVMLARDGRVLVLDFGLALARGQSRVTSSQVAVGTFPYMAPEQLEGSTADARSDLYGLGCVGYEMLTGITPFGGEGPAQGWARLYSDPRPPSALRPEVPPDVDRIVVRLLARNRADRYPNADALLADLRARVVRGGARGGGAEPVTDAAERAPAVAGGWPSAPASDEAVTAPWPPVAYLLVPPISVEGADAPGPAGEIAASLHRAAGSVLASAGRLHVVATDEPAPADTADALRAFARRHGANLVLLATLRSSGHCVRVTYAVHDAERGTRIAGDSVDGSALEPFPLEDELIAAIRRSLGLDGPDSARTARVRGADPAAGERYAQARRYLERHDQEAAVDGAIRLLEDLRASEGERADVEAALARAYLRKLDLTRQHAWTARAAQAAARAQALDPEAAETLVALAELHRVCGRPERAREEWARALGRAPDSVEAMLGLARARQDGGEHDEAVRLCQRAIAARPGDWRGYSRLGQLYFERGLYERAVEPWRRVVQLTPDNARAARNLGSAYYHMDRFDEALAAFHHSLELQPNAIAHTNLGTVLYILARFDEAAESFEKAVALTPSDPALWGNLGCALIHVGDRELRAREALERAVGLARAHHDRGDRTPESRARLASWLSSLDRHDEALAEIAAALEASPDNVHVMVQAAHVLIKSGRRTEGLDQLARAVGRGYGVEALRRSPELAALRGDPAFERILTAGAGPRGPGPGVAHRTPTGGAA